MIDGRAQMSAYVEKWTSTSSILHHHAKVSCLSWSVRTLGQPQGCSVLEFLGMDISLKCASTNTVVGLKQNLHHYRNRLYKIYSYRAFCLL